jgi:thiopeptide-type bacteriocin biosynthesis protein
LRLSPSASGQAVVAMTRRWAGRASPGEGDRSDVLREVAYVPELDRYGGERGMGIAEEQFDLSSRVTLEVLRDTRQRGRALLLGRSLLLSLILVRSLLDGREASRDFLKGYSESYGRQLPAPTAATALASSAEAAPGLERAVAAFERAWQEGNGLGVALLDEWARGCRRLRSRLDEAGASVLGPDPAAGRGRLLSSYLHMHHNRLGLEIAQEVALARMAADAVAQPART